jgi:uncharacterized protein (TIGR00730 family)
MNEKTPAVCVFCGSSFGTHPAYEAAARRLGELIGERGFSLVFGGGCPGLMGTVSRAASESGAKVMGVLPDFLRWVERPPEWEEELIITPDLQQRKSRLLDEADAFVVLPGGAGTLDEFFEVVTSAQLKVLGKPIVLVNTNGFFAPLEALLRHLVEQGFAKPFMLELFQSVETPEEAIDLVAAKLDRG